MIASVGSEVQVTAASAAAPGALDAAIASIVANHPPLIAVHCIAENDGEAEALAQRWEDVLVVDRQAVPPIIAYTGEARTLGTTGMIRVAADIRSTGAQDCFTGILPMQQICFDLVITSRACFSPWLELMIARAARRVSMPSAE